MNKFSIFNFQFSIFLILFGFLLFPFETCAASLNLNLDKSEVAAGGVLNATISLDTEDQSINTIEGDLKYDDNLLKAEIINIGGSFVSFWVEKPNLKTSGLIHFAGVVPGGLSIKQGEVFKIIFRVLKEGDTNLSFNNVNLFLNDGQGTMATTKLSDANVKITPNTNNTDESIVTTDFIPPEEFRVVRTRDKSVYDNKWFLAFNTLDKGYGINYYEVCEYWMCVTGDSPYLLKYQNPFYHIVVYAYDMNGNVRDSSLTSTSFMILLAFLFLLAIICLWIFFRKKLIQK